MVEKLAVGEIYHIFTKSIAGFKIFNNDQDFLRMTNIMEYYRLKELSIKFSEFARLNKFKNKRYDKHCIAQLENKEMIIQIVSYCFMPTHAHFIIKQLKDDGISDFMRKILNSYTRYFNVKHNRKGPLWEGRFKRVLVKTDEQLLHLTRYVHLNPVTSYLVNNAEDWPYSSYCEFIGEADYYSVCQYRDILDIDLLSYRNFVEDRIEYQRELAKIKKLLFD